jgi:hypothetical protein
LESRSRQLAWTRRVIESKADWQVAAFIAEEKDMPHAAEHRQQSSLTTRTLAILVLILVGEGEDDVWFELYSEMETPDDIYRIYNLAERIQNLKVWADYHDANELAPAIPVL